MRTANKVEVPEIKHFQTEQGVIINGNCSCGHLQSSHADRFAPNHGACVVAGCKCPQFTWTSHVFRNK